MPGCHIALIGRAPNAFYRRMIFTYCYIHITWCLSKVSITHLNSYSILSLIYTSVQHASSLYCQKTPQSCSFLYLRHAFICRGSAGWVSLFSLTIFLCSFLYCNIEEINSSWWDFVAFLRKVKLGLWWSGWRNSSSKLAINLGHGITFDEICHVTSFPA